MDENRKMGIRGDTKMNDTKMLTAQHSLRRRLLASTVTEKDDNLIDLNAYGESANAYVQDIAIDNAKAYYAHDINYIVCYSKWGSNLGLATIASDGTVTTKPDTITIRVNISKNKNPYFGLTRR